MKSLPFSLTLAMGLLSAVALPAADGSGSPAPSVDSPSRTEQWLPARTLVWTKPGENGTALESGNWTEYASAADYEADKDGKPAETGPDANTDLILPQAADGQSYIVGFMVSAQQRTSLEQPDGPTLACRHMTIGAGTALDGGMGVTRGRASYSGWSNDDSAAAISGNVTVADGGYVYGHLQFVGDEHTRFSMARSPAPLCRSLLVRKAKGASVTIDSPQLDVADGVTVESGRLILSSGTNLRVNAGDQPRKDIKKLRSTYFGRIEPYVHVGQKAALEMRPGSRIGRVNPPDDIAPDMRIEGLLQIGKAGEKSAAPAVIELTMAEGDGAFLNQPGGLYIQPTAEVRNDGTLFITSGDPNAATTTKGISIFLEKAMEFGKVTIDGLRAGGIASTDPAGAKRALASATFGEHCTAEGDALHSKIELLDFAGGFGTVEFVDGLATECEILFPLGERLIVRSKGNRTIQSLDLSSVHAVTIGGKRIEHHPQRDLTAEEKRLREVNALWADVPGKGQIGKYAGQNWSRLALMVWRRPGESGSRFVPANWLDGSGRPYFDLPISNMHLIYGDPYGYEVDVLLPTADDFYQAVGDRPQWPFRHMTIENNAFFHLTYNISGNLWMKDGSGMQAPWNGGYRNPRSKVHRFLRFDGKRIGRPGTIPWPLEYELPEEQVDRKAAKVQMITPRSAGMAVSRWGRYGTGPGSTLEVIGSNQVGDQFYVNGEGTIIVSAGGYLAPGGRSSFAIAPESTVVLLQDARIGMETAAMQEGRASVWVGGTLMIGTPERPITKDMLFPVTGIEEDKIIRNPTGSGRTPGCSLLVSKGGRLILHSADPAKARLVFKMHDSEKAKRVGKRWGDAKGIVLAFLGQTSLNGVVFDNVLKEGIMVSPEQRAKWKNVFYGENNLAPSDELFWNVKAEE